MICPNCHNDNREGAKYCDNCGFPLSGIVAEKAHAADEALEGKRISADADDAASDAADSDLLAALKSVKDESTETEKTLELPVISIEDEEEDSENHAEDNNDNPDSLEDDTDEQPSTEAEESGNDDDRKSDDNSVESERKNTESDATCKLPVIDPDKTADLSGIDTSSEDIYVERLVDDSYEAPKPNFRDGATMEMPVIKGVEAESNKDFRSSATKKKNTKGKKIALSIACILAACGIFAAVITYQYELWGGKTVPDVTGMTLADATNTLEDQGFTVRSTQVKSDDTEGLVLIEDPEGKSRQPEGSEVVIHISVARAIPSVVGKTKDEAATSLGGEGLENVTYEETLSDEPEGTVLGISPDAGTKVTSDTAVTVQVAKPYTVPDISGMTLTEAQNAITEAGLKYQIYYTYSEQYQDGTILGTQPAPGEVVEGGSFVNVNVTKTRSTELVAATQSLLYSGAQVSIGGVNYTVNSLESAQYIGSNQTSYSITATPYISLLGETLAGSPRAISGTITWTDNNTVQSIS